MAIALGSDGPSSGAIAPSCCCRRFLLLYRDMTTDGTRCPIGALTAPLHDGSATQLFKLLWDRLPRRSGSAPLETADHLLSSGLYRLRGGRTVDLRAIGPKPLAVLGRTERREIHMHAFVGDLIHAAAVRQDASYLRLAIELCGTWRAAFPHDVQRDRMAYHDETVAQRVGYGIKLHMACRTFGLGEAVERLRAALACDVAILLEPQFHAGLNNHGMFQDLALLYYATFDLAQADVRTNALDRLERYFASSITSDGVHKEHSPSYHYLIASKLSVHLDLVRHFDAERARRFETLLSHMADYAVNIVAPDGCYPPIGDTQPHPIPHHYYATFGCTEPERVPAACRIYAAGGYAIFRDDPSKGAQQTYAVLCASHHGSYHKHNDDLSVLLYSDGWILGESGPFGYDYAHRHCKHAYSSAAHSTLIVDREPNLRDPSSRVTGLVKIVDHADSASASSATAVNRRLRTVTHRRSLTLDRRRQIIIVDDAIDAADRHTFTLLWQLAPGLRASIEGLDCHLLRGSVRVATLHFASDRSAICRSTAADADPQLPGYSFSAFGCASACVVVQLSTESAGAWKVHTEIQLVRRGPPDSAARAAVHAVLSAIPGPCGATQLQLRCMDVPAGTQVAFYLCLGNQVVRKIAYGASSVHIHWNPAPGVYRCRAFMRDDSGLVRKGTSNSVRVT